MLPGVVIYVVLITCLTWLSYDDFDVAATSRQLSNSISAPNFGVINSELISFPCNSLPNWQQETNNPGLLPGLSYAAQQQQQTRSVAGNILRSKLMQSSTSASHSMH